MDKLSIMVYGQGCFLPLAYNKIGFNIFSANHFAFLQRYQSFRQVLCHCGSWHCPSLFFVQGT